MPRTVRTLLITALALAAPATAAEAATPFTAGVGKSPSVAVGGEGSGHVVWATTEDDSRVGYCRVAAGASACNRTHLLSFPGLTDANSTGRPVVFTPAPSKVVIVAGCWSCGAGGVTDRTYRWISLNNGQSFGAAAEIDRGLETQGTGVWLEDLGSFVGASHSRIKAADLTTGEGVQYATGGIFTYGPEVVRVPGSNKLVAATNDLDVVKYGVFDGAPFSVAGINGPTNWLADRTLSAPEGDNSDSDLNSGPNGVYLTYRYFVPNDSRVGLRRFDPVSNTFGAPLYVEGPDGIDGNSLDYPDSHQDPSGRLHVLWRSLYGGGRLRYRVSDPTGANFSAAANLAVQEGFYEPRLAAGADGRGFAAWTPGSTGNIRIVPLDPQPEPAPPGGGTTPPPGGGSGSGGGGGGGPTIMPSFSFSGPGSVLTARIVGRRIKVRMKGVIGLPAGASPATACTGKVRLKLKKRKRVMLNRTVRVKLRRGKCRFAKTAYLKRSKVGKTRKLRLKVRFMGNSVLAAGSRRFTLTIRK